MKRLHAAVVTAVIGGLVGFMSCSEDASSTGIGESSITGSWDCTTIDSELMLELGPGVEMPLDTLTTLAGVNSFVLNDNHSFTFISTNAFMVFPEAPVPATAEEAAIPDTVTGTWALSDVTLTMTSTDSGILTGTITLSGDKLILVSEVSKTTENNGMTVNITGESTITFVSQ